jgi:hypothetical protein
MSFGKSNNQMSQDPRLTAAQAAQVEASNKFSTNTLIPTYENAVKGATDVYNQGAGGVLNAAQNQAGAARQAQATLGSTGESALRTGISGLESLFSPDYEQNQIRNALLPAQQQYMQNLASQKAQYGGAGNLGSARSALAQTALAGQTQASQQKAASDIQAQIAAQRLQAGQNLASLGQGGIGQALGAAGQGVSAAMTPQQLYNQYASVIFGTPAASYTPDFRGTQGSTKTENTSGFQAGMGGAYGSKPFSF